MRSPAGDIFGAYIDWARTAASLVRFIEPISKNLPLEYAVELNRLVELEMEGSVG